MPHLFTQPISREATRWLWAPGLGGGLAMALSAWRWGDLTPEEVQGATRLGSLSLKTSCTTVHALRPDIGQHQRFPLLWKAGSCDPLFSHLHVGP